jgi:hypothetical protein
VERWGRDEGTEEKEAWLGGVKARTSETEERHSGVVADIVRLEQKSFGSLQWIRCDVLDGDVGVWKSSGKNDYCNLLEA